MSGVVAAVSAISLTTVAYGAAIGAAMGGISAAIQGGDIGMGILGGAIGGGVTGGLGSGLGSMIGAQAGTFGGIATGALSTAAGGAVNAAITGADPLNGAMMGAVTGGISGGMGAFDVQADASGMSPGESQGLDSVQANQMASGELPQGPTQGGLTLDATITQPQSGVQFVPDSISATELPASATDALHGDLVQEAASALQDGNMAKFREFDSMPQVQEAAKSLAGARDSGQLVMSQPDGSGLSQIGNQVSDSYVPGLPIDQNMNNIGSNAAQSQWDTSGTSNYSARYDPQVASQGMGAQAAKPNVPQWQQDARAWGSKPISSLWSNSTPAVPGAAVVPGAAPAAAPWGTTGVNWVDTPVNWIQNNKMLAAGGGLSLLSAMNSDSGQQSSPGGPAGSASPSFNKPLPQYGYLQPGGNVTQFRQVAQRPGGLSASQTWGYNAQGQMVPVSTDANGNLTQVQGMKRGGPVHGGQDDTIPIMAARGEYVIPADVVSGLGDGYTGAGAKKLDDMVANIRGHKGSPKKLPKKSKPSATDYLRRA